MKATFSVWSGYYSDLSFEDAVLEFKRNGVMALELANEHAEELLRRGENIIEIAKQARAFLDKEGVTVTQGHLPFKFGIVAEKQELPNLLRYIDMFEAMGITEMVLHCDRLPKSPEYTAQERLAMNIESLKIIAEHVKDKDIYICLENLRQPQIHPVREPLAVAFADDLLKMIELVGCDRFAICLDTGHLNLVSGNQREFILKAGKHLRALHIADNQNLADMDQHLLPFSRGTVNFFEVVEALREIDYVGMFNFELPGEMRAPLPIRAKKLEYTKFIYDYLMSENA